MLKVNKFLEIFIIDSNDSLTSECTYPDSLIATSPSRTWTIKPEFLIASGGRATMDIPPWSQLHTQSTVPKRFQVVEFPIPKNLEMPPIA